MNYRLSALGFLYMGHPESPGNVGLLDQVMALDWVQENIHYFGGDPSNVTLFGESAGSVSVSLHLLSPLSRNKFARAIMQSGGPTADWAVLSPEESFRRSKELARLVNCSSDQRSKIIDCLRRPFPVDIVKWDFTICQGIMQYCFVAVVDGIFLPDTPRKLLQERNFKKCPILLGSNRDEGNYFIIYEHIPHLSFQSQGHTTRAQYDSALTHLFRFYPRNPVRASTITLEAIAFRYRPWYTPDDIIANREAVDDAVGDFHFLCSTNEIALAYAKVGQSVFYYYYTHRSSHNPWPSWMGVMHADEVNYVFGEPLLSSMNYTHEEKRLAARMMNFWVNFAKTGDPNVFPGRPSLQEWPLHDVKDRKYLELNIETVTRSGGESGIGRGPRLDYCSFWYPYLPQLVDANNHLQANYSLKPCVTSPISRMNQVTSTYFLILGASVFYYIC